MGNDQVSENHSAKQFLLEEYKYLQESFWKNEAIGETRVNFFLTLVTAVLAGLVALATSQMSPEKNRTWETVPDEIFQFAGWAITALLVFGFFTMQRLIKRNRVTDGYKKDMDKIRQRFKDYFDPQGVLENYYLHTPTPSLRPSKNDDSDRNSFSLKGSVRRPVGLTYLVLSINTILLPAAAYGFDRDIKPAWVIALTFVFLGLQLTNIVLAERQNFKRLWKNEVTHAGGVVFRRTNAGTEFMVVTALRDKSQWVLPKGHLKKYESHNSAAVREVEEETGVFARIRCPLSIVAFQATNADGATEEVVCKYYLMQWISNGSGGEKREIRWLGYEQSRSLLTHKSARDVLDRAIVALEKLPDEDVRQI